MYLNLKKKHYFAYFPVVFLILFFLSFVVLYTIRGVMLRKTIGSIEVRLKNHQYISHWDRAEFRGLNRLFVKGIYIRDIGSKSEIEIDSLVLKLRIIPLAFRKFRIKEFSCKRVYARYFSEVKPINQDSLKSADMLGILDESREFNLAAFLGTNVRKFFSYLPSETSIRLLEVRINYAGRTTYAALEDLKMMHGHFTAKLMLKGDGTDAVLPVEGWLDKSMQEIGIRMSHAGSGLLPMPVLLDKTGIAAGFDSLDISVRFVSRKRNLVSASGRFLISGLAMKGNGLSADGIMTNHMESYFSMWFRQDCVELDSLSSVSLNKIQFNPFIRICLSSKPVIDFKIIPVVWKANDLFYSLPEGIFASLKGLKAEGRLSFFLDFRIDMNMPDSLIFNTRLAAEDFRILDYGRDDYRMINEDFDYMFYENGKLLVTFPVGFENPDFTPFEQISPYLRAAVMTSEDGSFFFHRGFNPDAFRESIVTNIREKRFARGGSTISMQLVKNIFLNRNKDIGRKIEEALIVWLIENQHLVSKQRMFEVYLNIIEWGPGIYGINQASRFYFNKAPADLDLRESIFLASIIPRPKWYKYTFENNGVPKTFFSEYFGRLLAIMVRKKLIDSADTVGIKPDVLLTGPAAKVFVQTDTAAVDSFLLLELERIPARLE
jgi:hypothetical protein